MPDYDLNYLWGGLSIGYWTEMCPGEVPWGDWSAKSIKGNIGQIATNIITKVKQALQVEEPSFDYQDPLTGFLTRYWETVRAERNDEGSDEDYLFE